MIFPLSFGIFPHKFKIWQGPLFRTFPKIPINLPFTFSWKEAPIPPTGVANYSKFCQFPHKRRFFSRYIFRPVFIHFRSHYCFNLKYRLHKLNLVYISPLSNTIYNHIPAQKTDSTPLNFIFIRELDQLRKIDPLQECYLFVFIKKKFQVSKTG